MFPKDAMVVREALSFNKLIITLLRSPSRHVSHVPGRNRIRCRACMYKPPDPGYQVEKTCGNLMSRQAIRCGRFRDALVRGRAKALAARSLFHGIVRINIRQASLHHSIRYGFSSQPVDEGISAK